MRTEDRDVRLRWVAGLVILSVTAARVAYLFCYCPYDLAPDEAHYWDWSRHLDWSYYSKGPLVAWLIRAGCEFFGPLAESTTGTLMPAVRLPAVLCGAGMLAAVYLLTRQTYRSDRMALGVMLGALTLPGFAAASILMTIDAPFLCCWAWALVFGRLALVDGRRWAWPATGLLVALGILAKYTMALWLVSAGLFVLFTPTHRRLLARPGFWVMAAVAGLSALPILYWNAQNDWVTFRHVAAQAGVAEAKRETGIRWFGPFEYVAGQSVVLLGVWFAAWVAALIRYRPRPGVPAGLTYLWWMSVPTFAVFGLSSLRAGGQLNWPVAAYLSGAILVGGWVADVTRDGRHRLVRRGVRFALFLGAVLTLLAHDTHILTGLVAPDVRPDPPDNPGPAAVDPALARHEDPTPLRRFDPAARLKGHRHLGDELDDLRRVCRACDGADPVLATFRWDEAGALGFYTDGHPQAYAVGVALGLDRHSQYDLWHPNPVADAQAFRGRTFLVVSGFDPAPMLRPAFDSVSPGHRVVYREHDRAIARWFVCVCRGFKGFDPSLWPAAGDPGH